MQLLRVFQVIDRKSATLGLPSEEQVLKGTSNTIYRLSPSNLEAILEKIKPPPLSGT